jgi:aminoglycoside phosphotransferase (APT) family kinase protein
MLAGTRREMKSVQDELAMAGLLAPGEQATVEPLTGGVSSDISLVTVGSRRFCIKRALAKLKVAADWRAPVERNRSEVAWLKVAATVQAGCVPDVLADRSADGWFAMAYLDPATHPVWKAQLRDGIIDVDFAAAVGRGIGRIHAATAGRADLAQQFSTDYIFYPIRLEAYLVATANQHPEVASALHQLIQTTQATKLALVHGDVSPKNILCRQSNGAAMPVFLDAECAWYGDPAFDLAFVLNHLLLKCLWRPQHTAHYLACFDALRDEYVKQVNWETIDSIDARTARLLVGLLLARIDGKSPVEYVTDEAQKNLVRDFAVPLLAKPPRFLAEVREAWGSLMGVKGKS